MQRPVTGTVKMTKVGRPASAATQWLVLALGLVLAGCPRPSGPPLPDPDTPPISIRGTEEWYAANEALVREYLTTLPASARGTQLKGITLSDGARWLEGYTFLGRSEGLPSQVKVTLFRDGQRRLAYLWIEPGGEPLPLPQCESSKPAGIRARRLGGGVYAWRALRPEHGIVFTDCPPDEWMPRDETAPAPAPEASPGSS